VHLIKNAFGGSRRSLFESVMTIQPPLSRNVRDDVTVTVIFFGVDAGEIAAIV
jgi:pyruvate dehydrogenase phosphatase